MIVPAVIGVPGALLYGRVYSVTLQTQTGSSAWGNEDGSQTPLRVRMQVERNVSNIKQPNKAEVSIFNLSPQSRSAFAKGSAVLLRAGYVGSVGTLFIGLVAKIAHERQGPDVETKLTLADSDVFTTMTTLDRSYPPGTTAVAILADCAQAMHLNFYDSTVSVSQGVAIGLPVRVYSGGFVAHGPVRSTLNRVCRPLGLDWSIANAALQIIPQSHYDGREAQILSRETGLVGVPGDGGGFCTMEALLTPHLVPGCLVILQSQNAAVNGTYKLRKTVFEGDSHGDSWTVKMEGLPYEGQVLPLVSASGPSLLSGALA